MTYPKRNLINGLLFVLGLSPFHEPPQFHWRQKVRPLGFLLSLVHLGMTIFTYVRETQRAGYLKTNPNNIIQGTVVIKRLLAVLTPIGLISARFCYLKTLELFWEKLRILDRFLKDIQRERESSWEESYEKKVNKSNFLAGSYAISIEGLNLLFSFLYYYVAHSKETPLFVTIYFYHFATTIYSTAAMDIYSRVNALGVRVDLFAEFVENISREILDLNGKKEEEVRVRRRRMLEEFSGKNSINN